MAEQPKKIGELTRPEAETLLTDLRKQLVELRFRKVLSHLENPMVIRSTRREIARVLTHLTALKREA